MSGRLSGRRQAVWVHVGAPADAPEREGRSGDRGTLAHAGQLSVARWPQRHLQVQRDLCDGCVANPAPSSDNTYSALVKLDTNNFPTNITPVIITCQRTANGLVCKTTNQPVVMLVPFPIKASINGGTIAITIPDLDSGATGILDVIFMNSKTNSQVIVSTKQNQFPGQVTLSLDDIITGSQNTPLKPLDNQDASVFDGVCCRWRVGAFDITTGETPFDVTSVEVLAKRIISNYFSPTWGGSWTGSTLQKGVYPAGQFPGGLYSVGLQTEFLNAQDPENEGLAMDGNTVTRSHIQPAQSGFNQYVYLDGSDLGYIENPDRDQANASSPTHPTLRSTSVAVRTDADRLKYDDEVYVPQFGVRTVDDSGTLHGNTNQIDVWLGQGADSFEQQANAYGVVSGITCLKILTQ
jgi:hypothetical protein